MKFEFGPEFVMQELKAQAETFKRKLEMANEEIETLRMRVLIREEQISELHFENQKLKAKLVTLPVEGSVS